MAEPDQRDAATAGSEDPDLLLREFLASSDAPCPACGMSVLGNSDALCPACGSRLILTLDTTTPRFGWFLVTVAPLIVTWGLAFILIVIGAFSGPVFAQIGPCLLLIVAAVDVPVAVALWERREALLAAPPARQRQGAAVAWGIHVVLAAATIGALFL